VSRVNLFQIKLSSIFLLAHLLVFFITPLLFKEYYFFENVPFFLISLISLISIMAAFIAPIPSIKNIYFTPRKGVLNLLFFIFMILVLYRIATGLEQVGSDKVMESLKNEMTGRGVVSVLISLLIIAGMFQFSYLFHHRMKLFVISYSLFFISVVLVSAHRTPVVIAMVSPLLVYVILKYRGIINPLLISISAGVIFTVMYAMNFFRQGMTGQLLNNEFNLYTASLNSLSGLNTSKYLYDLIIGNYPIEYFSNSYYWILAYIPRRLYPEKPVVSFNVRTTESFYEYIVGDFKGADIRTFTLPGEGYIQFSYIGVILLTFLAVYMSRFLISIYLRFEYSEFLIVGFLFSVLINFRSAFDSFLHSVVYSIILLTFLIPILFNMKKKGYTSDSSFLTK